LQHWAAEAAESATAQARQEHPQAVGHAKKKFTGTASSVRSV
jgi:hypothetical protein